MVALKEQLQEKMKVRREQARQKRQELYDLDNEEGGFDAEEEAEMSERSDTDVEDDEEVDDEDVDGEIEDEENYEDVEDEEREVSPCNLTLDAEAVELNDFVISWSLVIYFSLTVTKACSIQLSVSISWDHQVLSNLHEVSCLRQ